MTRFKKLPRGWPCKPCWELKYCPYGPLVEFFPLLDPEKPKTSYMGSPEVMKWAPVGHLKLLQEADPYEISCNIFGHVCPVFVMAEGMTETEKERYSGRVIPRDIMLKVVRRDDYMCQACHNHVPDDQIEIDHVIPHSKGGPTTVDNLRLLCRACNRKKSDSLAGLLNEFARANYSRTDKSATKNSRKSRADSRGK
jgi:HNH endonuclease